MESLKIGTKRDNQIELEVNRVESLLNDTLRKLEFNLKIPETISTFLITDDTLSSTDKKLIKKAFHTFLDKTGETFQESRHLKGEEFEGIQHLKDFSTNQMEHLFNSYQGYKAGQDEYIYDMSTALYICNENATVQKLLLNCNITSSGALSILQDLRHLFLFFLEKIKLTPEKEMQQERRQRKFYIQHKELFDNASITETQDSEELFLKRTIESKKSEWENKLGLENEECQEYIQNLRKEADNTMALDWLRSEQKQEVLLEQIDIEVKELENMRKGFIEEERKIWETKNQIDEELLIVIEQYNKDMMQKYKVYESKKEIYEREKEQLNGLQEKYDKQTIEFETLMEEKRAYEDKIIEAKMYELRRKLAARRIQRFYRKFRNLILIHGRRDGQKSKQRKKKIKA